ncbi:MAG: CpsD/CapB family tyrosine-protein kinase [Hyphomonadaceae bacterium]
MAIRASAPLSGFDEPANPARTRTMVAACVVLATAALVIVLPENYAIFTVAAAMAGLSAWLLGGLIARHRGLRSPAEAARRVGLPALGMVQQLTPRVMREISPDQRTPYGYVLEKPESAFASVFRHLLAFSPKAKNRRETVAITSPYSQEGASTVSLCLARTMAALGRSVVIVDCDMRRRTLTRSLGIDAKEGIWEAIGAENPGKFLRGDTDSHVKVLPAGSAAGPFRDLFSKRGFFDLVRQLKRRYECVILDCPAALASIDARMIVGGADSVVLVVQHGRTPASAVKNAQRQLNIGGHARPAGILINKAPKSRDFMQIEAVLAEDF